MIADCTLVLLCAGRSKRFGEGSKLLEPLYGRPLVQHTAATLGVLPFARRLAVVPADDEQLGRLLIAESFDLVPNTRPQDGASQSIRLGLEEAARLKPTAVLVALGDMPFVTPVHIRRLIHTGRPALSLDPSGWRSPPALFPAIMVEALLENREDPRETLKGAPDVALQRAAPGELVDFDTLDDFRSATDRCPVGLR